MIKPIQDDGFLRRFQELYADFTTLLRFISRQPLDKDVTVHLPGGPLRIRLRDDGHVILSGRAQEVFGGERELPKAGSTPEREMLDKFESTVRELPHLGATIDCTPSLIGFPLSAATHGKDQ